MSDELGVPDSSPDPETMEHVLPDEKLSYPTFDFDSGAVSPRDGFDLDRDLDREEMQEWLDGLAGALASHDAAVEGADTRVTFGVAPSDVRMSFDPDDDHRGQISVTFTLDAKALKYEDADTRPVGARGGRGFIPLAMLAEDGDPESYRCYNWIDDPTPRSDGDVDGVDPTAEQEDG